MIRLIKRAYKSIVNATLKPATVTILRRSFAFLDNRAWAPIFYFFLPQINTAAMDVLHVLQKVQVTTGRRIIVVSAWPFWPAATANDRFFTSFMKGLTPNIRYIWIPLRLQIFFQNFINLLSRSVQMYDDLYLPAGLDSTIRYGGSSTFEHTDILNHGNRVSLRMPSSHEQVLETQLKEIGVPPDAWFVCVHAREHGWLRELNAYNLKPPAGYRKEQEDHRNVDIEDYFPAIDYITSRGGLVVRMGDPSMKRVCDIDGVIDYPFTKYKSMPMDLYLLSNCKFVLGCNSGFSSCLPHTFDTPVLVTNMTPLVHTASWPYSNDLFLFMHAIENGSGRAVSPKEMCQPDKYKTNDAMNNAVRFDSLGYRWRSNSPEDILEAVKEILQLVDYNSFDQPRTAEQELFHQYRLQALDSFWSPADRRGDTRYAKMRSSESRISAAFAARYFLDDKLQAIKGEL